MPVVPFYLDWTFWSFVAAIAAVILSQLPPIGRWFRRARLEVDVQSDLNVTHHLGHVNIQAYVSVSNVGRKSIRVTGVTMKLWREGVELPTLPARGLFESLSAQKAVVFVPFLLKVDEHWGHILHFFEALPRAADNKLRKLASDMKAEIMAAKAKRDKVDPEDRSDIPGSPQVVIPVLDHFKATFPLEEGEYQIQLTVNTAPPNIGAARSFRFTLHESDSQILRAYSNGYVSGAGVFYELPDQTGIRVQMAPQ